ncbi:BQ5605_C008g05294 [Microbotryum silenes-dioicae]|uniref:BQ5605_C008g05294 protein n=1 Tax=Microbotryum silenes-dioicae TaxID=796604 RepID=A0A2X0P865_9BASI|nr:BQ5605_C008g05294 [Microbotryum silenes-dioicae]
MNQYLNTSMCRHPLRTNLFTHGSSLKKLSIFQPLQDKPTLSFQQATTLKSWESSDDFLLSKLCGHTSIHSQSRSRRFLCRARHQDFSGRRASQKLAQSIQQQFSMRPVFPIHRLEHAPPATRRLFRQLAFRVPKEKLRWLGSQQHCSKMDVWAELTPKKSRARKGTGQQQKQKQRRISTCRRIGSEYMARNKAFFTQVTHTIN